jgi:hypothetical protein
MGRELLAARQIASFSNVACRKTRVNKIVIHPGDYVQTNSFGADRLAFANIGALAETFLVHARDHSKRAAVALGLTLRKDAEVGDLRAGE